MPTSIPVLSFVTAMRRKLGTNAVKNEALLMKLWNDLTLAEQQKYLTDPLPPKLAIKLKKAAKDTRK